MTLASIWTFLKRIPEWVWLALAGLLIGFAYVEREKERARREVNDRRDREALELERKVVNHIEQNSIEMAQDAARVRAAPTARELPDGTVTLAEYHYRD